jgi:hypothetical protein
MGFDLFFLNIPPQVTHMSDIPKGIPPLGPLEEVLNKVRTSYPALKLDETGFGDIDGGSYSIEIDIGNDDPVDSIMVTLRGGPEGIDALAPIFAQGFRAVAPGIDTIASTPADLHTAFAAFTAYRDTVTDE